MADPMTDAPPLPPDVPPGLAATLPLLYVAWSDGLLTSDEIAAVRARVADAPWLTDDDRVALARWLDPDAPPSATEYFGWVRTLRDAAARMPADRRAGLADLGVALAGDDATDEQRRALAEIEDALGVAGPEIVRALGGPAADAPPARPAPPAFAPETMQARLDGRHAALRARVRALLAGDAFGANDPAWSKERFREVTLERLRVLADAGLGALAYPDWASGEGDIGAFIATMETISTYDLSLAVKYGVQFGLWGGSVNGLGTDAQRRALLPGIGTLDLPGAFAMSERRHGSNVRDLATTATFDAGTDEWVIRTPEPLDHKEWIGNAAAHGRHATVFAQLVTGGEEHGVHAFVVPIRAEDGSPAPGVRIADSGHKMGLNGVDNGQLWFDDVRVPREALLGRFATVTPDGRYESPIPSAGKRFFTMLGVLVGGRVAVGSGALAAATAGLTIAVRYGDRRRQFGPAGGAEVPVLDYLTHQRRLLPLVATSYGLAFALHDLADAFADASAAAAAGEPEAGASPPAGDADHPRIETEAAALKAMASWHATRSLQEAREACGGEGYRTSSGIALRKADSDIFTTFEGDNTVLLLQVAKNLLAGYRQEFSDLNVVGMLRYLRELADVKLGEMRPSVRLGTAEEHLLDPAFHADLFRRRERTLLVSAAARLKRRMDAGMDSFDAFVEVQDHLLTLAHAHAERLVLERFQAAVEREADDQLRTVLSLLCALYALAHVERAGGWYQEQGVLEGNVTKAVRTQVNALLHRLRPLAVELVDAFGIPDALLQSAIAPAVEPIHAPATP